MTNHGVLSEKLEKKTKNTVIIKEGIIISIYILIY